MLFGASACSKPDFNEDQALAAVGFNDPINFPVQLNQVFNNQGGWWNDDDPPRAAILLKSGIITILPSQAAPWWHFNASGGTLQSERFTLPIAKRVVTGHSDEKTWSEAPYKFYAVTITYNVEVDSRIAIDTKNFGPYTMRLVMVLDPAVGTWQVYEGFGRGTHFDPQDAVAMTQALIAQGCIRVLPVYRYLWTPCCAARF
jgi:hypothetical protein